MATPGSGGGFRTLGGALVLVAVVVALGLLVARLGSGAGGAEGQVLSELHALAKEGLRVPVSGTETPLVGSRVRLGVTTVLMEEGGERAIAVALLDFTGRLGSTEVSSLGYERVPFVRSRGGWVPEHGPAPRLAASVAALEARRRAVEAGDLGALEALQDADGPPPTAVREVQDLLTLQRRRYEVRSWILRSEREEVLVAEHFRLTGDGREAPVDRLGLRNLRLVPENGNLTFSPGVM